MFGYITFIKWNLDRVETHLSRKTYNLEDSDCKYLYGTELACNGNIFRPLVFQLWAGSLYLFQTPNAVLKLIVCS
jgi:hypothetical protein